METERLDFYRRRKKSSHNAPLIVASALRIHFWTQKSKKRKKSSNELKWKHFWLERQIWIGNKVQVHVRLNNTVFPNSYYLGSKQLFYQFNISFLAKLLINLTSRDMYLSFFPEDIWYHMKFFKHFPLFLWFCSSACSELFQKKFPCLPQKEDNICLFHQMNDFHSSQDIAYKQNSKSLHTKTSLQAWWNKPIVTSSKAERIAF